MPKLPPADHQKRFMVQVGEHLPLRRLQHQAQAWLLGQAGAVQTPRQGGALGVVTHVDEFPRTLWRAAVSFSSAARTARERQRRAPRSIHPRSARRRAYEDRRESGAHGPSGGRGHSGQPVHRSGGVHMPDAGHLERGAGRQRRQI